MSSVSFTKIGFFGPGRRLAASEGPKIAGGASLARRRKARFSARLWGPRLASKVFSFLPAKVRQTDKLFFHQIFLNLGFPQQEECVT